MIPGIGWIDGDQWGFTQINAALVAKCFKRLAFSQNAFRELIGNGVMMNGNKRYVALVVEVSQPFAYPCQRQAAAMVFEDFSFNKLAIQRAIFIAASDLQFIAGFFVNRNEPGAVTFHQTENAKHAL